MYQLYIGNKNYSSWSLRPWLLMTHFEIAFEEVNVPLTGAGAHVAYSSNGLVPCLHDDGFQVWDTLAIAEFLHDAHPDKGLYPEDKYARARARSISAEMHSGFGALRSTMPMNIKLPRLKGRLLTDAESVDLARIDEIFVSTRAQFAGDKPYLFGDFSVADAMFAPVIWRLFTYNAPLSDEAQVYRDTMLAHPAMKAWADAAIKETTAFAHYDDVAKEFGGV